MPGERPLSVASRHLSAMRGYEKRITNRRTGNPVRRSVLSFHIPSAALIYMSQQTRGAAAHREW